MRTSHVIDCGPMCRAHAAGISDKNVEHEHTDVAGVDVSSTVVAEVRLAHCIVASSRTARPPESLFWKQLALRGEESSSDGPISKDLLLSTFLCPGAITVSPAGLAVETALACLSASSLLHEIDFEAAIPRHSCFQGVRSQEAAWSCLGQTNI